MAVTLNASTSSGFVSTADTSGTVEIQSNGSTKLTVSSTGAYGQLVSATAQASTSGTSIDFTSIPSWVKRITVMFSGVSTNGTSGFRFQLMVGGVAVTTNYTASQPVISGTAITTAPATVTNGFACPTVAIGSSTQGQIVLCKLSDSVWTANGLFYDSNATERVTISVGRVTSVGTVDGLRVTTSAGTDTFDAGTINILYEG